MCPHLKEQPLGEAVDPALESKEALTAIMRDASTDPKEEATIVEGMISKRLALKK